MSAVDDELLFCLNKSNEQECIGSEKREEGTAITGYGTWVGYSYDTKTRSSARTPTLHTAELQDKQQEATWRSGSFVQDVTDIASVKRASIQTVAEDENRSNSTRGASDGGNLWFVEPVVSTTSTATRPTTTTAVLENDNTGSGCSQDDSTLLLGRDHATSTAAVSSNVDNAEQSLSPQSTHLAMDDEALDAGALDDWKDYSCSTAWEYFINDVDNAIGRLEGGERGTTANSATVVEEEEGGGRGGAPAGGRRRPRHTLTYDGQPYVLWRVQRSQVRKLRQVHGVINTPFSIGGGKDGASLPLCEDLDLPAICAYSCRWSFLPPAPYSVPCAENVLWEAY